MKVALLRSVLAGSLSFLLRQGFGERVGGLSECSNVRKRSKLWGSDSAKDVAWIIGGDRGGNQEDMLNRDGRIS